MSKTSIEPKVFDFVYNIAMSDAIHRTNCEHNIIEMFNSDEFEEAKRTAHSAVYNHASNIITGSNIEVVDTANTVKASLNPDNLETGFKFGNAQKLINMTMKYLYIACSIDPHHREKFTSCNSPMDSIMRDFVYRSWEILEPDNRRKWPGFCISHAWSNMDGDSGIAEYYAFQDTIRKIIRCKDIRIDGNPISLLEFDYLFWDKAKALRDKNKDEQIRITEAIWYEFDNDPLHF